MPFCPQLVFLFPTSHGNFFLKPQTVTNQQITVIIITNHTDPKEQHTYNTTLLQRSEGTIKTKAFVQLMYKNAKERCTTTEPGKRGREDTTKTTQGPAQRQKIPPGGESTKPQTKGPMYQLHFVSSNPESPKNNFVKLDHQDNLYCSRMPQGYTWGDPLAGLTFCRLQCKLISDHGIKWQTSTYTDCRTGQRHVRHNFTNIQIEPKILANSQTSDKTTINCNGVKALREALSPACTEKRYSRVKRVPLSCGL